MTTNGAVSATQVYEKSDASYQNASTMPLKTDNDFQENRAAKFVNLER